MLGFPIKTEVNKKIPKSELFRSFEGTPEGFYLTRYLMYLSLMKFLKNP